MSRFTRKDFLESLFLNYFKKKEGFVMVKTIRPSDGKTSIRYFPNIEILSKEQYPADQHVFFSVCPHENMRPDKTSINYMVALWASLDLSPEGYSGRQTYFFAQPQAAKAIRSFPLPPSIIVETGWGIHLYWLLKEITPIKDFERVENLLRKINQYFQCKTEIPIDSLMRLPDTMNPKVAGHSLKCNVKYINPDFRYDFSELESLSLGFVSPSSKGTIFLHPVSDGSPDVAVVAVTDSPKIPITDKADVQGLETPTPLKERAGTLSPAADEVTSLGSAKAPHSEPDFVPLPYESSGEPEVKATDNPMLSYAFLDEETINRLANKIADRIVDRIGEKILDKLVKKLSHYGKPNS